MGSAIRFAAAALLFSYAAVASAGDKQQGSMINDYGLYSRDFCHLVVPSYLGFAGSSPAFINGLSKGKFQLKSSCDVEIKLGKLSDFGTLPVSDQIGDTGDEVICLVHVLQPPLFGPCGTILLRGEVKGNNPAARGVSIKSNLMAETGLCGVGSGLPLEARVVECYEPDPFYGAGVPAACGGLGGAWTPFGVSGPTQGWCYGGFGYLGNPPTPLIGVFGIIQ